MDQTRGRHQVAWSGDQPVTSGTGRCNAVRSLADRRVLRLEAEAVQSPASLHFLSCPWWPSRICDGTILNFPKIDRVGETGQGGSLTSVPRCSQKRRGLGMRWSHDSSVHDYYVIMVHGFSEMIVVDGPGAPHTFQLPLPKCQKRYGPLCVSGDVKRLVG